MASTPPAPATGPMQLPATWDAIASGYGEVTTRWFGSIAVEAMRDGSLEPTDRVLDVAAGPGNLAFALAPRVAQVTATDFSPGMIAELVARAARDHVDNVEGAVMDAHSLDLADRSFDAAFCLFAFMFFPDRAKAFGELLRVLRPGGRAVVATWGPIDRRPLMKIGFDAVAEVFPELPQPSKGDLQQPDECVAEMKAAGFREVSARLVTASARVGSAEEYLEAMERSAAPFAKLREKLGPAGWAAARARLVDAVRRHVPPGGADLTAEAVLTRAVR